MKTETIILYVAIIIIMFFALSQYTVKEEMTSHGRSSYHGSRPHTTVYHTNTGHSSGGGAVAGIVIGSICGVVLIGALVWWFKYRKIE